MKDTRAEFLKLLKKTQPKLYRAFEQAVKDIRSTAVLQDIASAIEDRDVASALRALNLGPEYWAPLERAFSEAYTDGGLYQQAVMKAPKALRLVFRFQGQHPRAVDWLRTAALGLTGNIAQDQQTLVRETIVEGIESGRGAMPIARDIVGRMDGGQRKGGLIGLTSIQGQYVRSARMELSDPALMSNYFKRTKRDRRFDHIAHKALASGRGVAGVDIDKMVGRYSDRLLVVRGQAVARTSALRALNSGRNEAIVQLVESGRVPIELIEKIWMATPSTRTRDTHMALNKTKVQYDEAFRTFAGHELMYPGDVDRGAPPEEIINCRCTVTTRIDYAKMAI